MVATKKLTNKTVNPQKSVVALKPAKDEGNL